MVLNSDFCGALLDFLVHSSLHVILCDGAANYIFNTKYRDAKNIKAVVGDLDSILPDVRAYYSTRVEVRDLSADQDTNDFEKGLKYALGLGCKRIVCLGILGKRFDQEMCNLSVLQKYSLQHTEADFVAIGKSSVIYVVKPQVHTAIKVGKQFIKNQIGMICFGKAKLETKGFKWNLGEKEFVSELQWGVLVSSSNEIVGEQVEITASNTVYFVAELDEKM